ncbi:hypothetical protein MU852_15765 [Brevundimonas albigilva]|uniref:hypothetical protein n=1 Tax=Brevundimonas albigilva TaxID=1312364 RepID=UPI00201B82B0|nr:hypothetical protein [Brevundimonas albigilva]UQV18178.1 hypothetical protein MU852_15765 [Brevundimonas albigilva]
MASHRPERAVRLIPAALAPAALPVRAEEGWPEPDPADPPLRPLQVFDPPQPVLATAEVPDHPPNRFIWRRLDHRLVRVEGPERIAPEWWRRLETPLEPTRDYYRVEDQEGRRFWLFRSGLRRGAGAALVRPRRLRMTAYAELAARSNFSFLEGASHPKHLVLSAILRGHTGLGLADRNTLAGVVRAWSALRDFREEGWAPEKKREGGGPGEFVWVEDPEFQHIDREMVKARAKAFKLILGARLRFNDGTPDILAYPEDRQGWAGLCRLLTLGNRRAKKGQCEIGLPICCGRRRGCC